MNFNQILIRLGVDATAVTAGLGKAGNTVKAWATGLIHDLKTGMGRMFGGFLIFEGIKRQFESIKEQIIEVNRMSEETGASTNFIQSIMLQAKIAGVALESLMLPITKFNALIGQAKMGHVEALEKLQEMGVAQNQGEADALGYESAMKKLKTAFDKAGSSAKQDAILFDAFGRQAYRMSPIFRQSAADFDKMFEGNFFTKMSVGTISDFMNMWKGLKEAGQATTSTIGNLLDVPLKGYRLIAQSLGVIFSGGAHSLKEYRLNMYKIEEAEKAAAFAKALGNQADQDGITVAEEKAQILDQQNQLLEKQAELTADIADRNKISVSEMAQMARKLTGSLDPLKMMHTVTPRMRTALKITNLEQQAKVDFLYSNDQKSQAEQSEADQMRKANPWMKRLDVDPLAKTNTELADVNLKLEPVQRMAEMINAQHK